MSGAYVAKPDVVPADDRPPGWDINWPWPGPFPPGFDWRDYEWPGLPGGGKPSDDETPRILVQPISGLTTRESDNGNFVGTNNSLIYINLTVTPTKGAISVPVTSRDISEGTVGNFGITLEFTEDNFDKPQAADLRGIMDDIEDGDVEYTIKVGPSTSNNVEYNDLFGSDVSVTNIETVWELRVFVQLSTSTSISVPLEHPTGYSRASGWFEVEAPKGTAKSETLDDNYYHPDDAYHTITNTITGQPETFEVFSEAFALATTGRDRVTFDITYRVTASTQNGQFPFGGDWYNTAKSTMVIYMELLRDGVVQSTDTDTITAEVNEPEDGSALGLGLDITSGEAHFLTDEGF
ncbi:hypothetical protein LCGC14_2301360 [marine sediment metagenome]|uniref:Uncharacterized protein n=1 Tax=marine sediment metagenome TaxID=412755 RepID=A0A0F9DAW0_9ZZZZ